MNEGENAPVTWLVFRSGGENLAIESSEVREILRNNEIYPLPFMPAYIKGVLNSYGDPYAVVDMAQFLGNESPDDRMFMILNNENNFALRITDIQEFHSNADVTMKNLSDSSESSYFTGAITFDDVTAPILSIKGILERIKADLERK
ncbi:MAG: chemotaxis protein CheW [Treponema sp.]|nr:chemotaxis protein CheW [Treponema sp.]